MKKVFGFFALLLFCSFSSARAQSSYAIAHRYPVEGNGRWDYIAFDAASGRVFVAHADMVQVLDPKTGMLYARILHCGGVHGVALADDLKKGFVSDGGENAVTVFDLRTFQPIAKIPVTGKDPDAIVYDRFTHRVFTFNGHSDNITAIDARTDSVIGTIALHGRPEFAVSDGHGMLYDNIEDKSEIAAIDPVTLSVKHYWPLAPGEGPTGLAIDTLHRRLFSVCANRTMVILDAASGKRIATAAIGAHPDAVVFDEQRHCALSSNGEGTITAVSERSPESFAVTDSIVTEHGARTIALDPNTGRLYLPAAELGPAPAPTSDNPHPHPTIKPNTFEILELNPIAPKPRANETRRQGAKYK